MSIDSSVGSRFVTATQKKKRAATNGATSDACLSVRHFKCRENGCPCGCHKTMSEVPRLAKRVEEDA